LFVKGWDFSSEEEFEPEFWMADLSDV